jgi:hypothetical protein
MRQLSLFSANDDEQDWTTDDWQTPDGVAIAMSRLVIPSDSRILEPCAGTGQIAKFLPQDRFVVCREVDRCRYNQGLINAPHCHWSCADYFEDEITAPYDLIITNPPFSRCVEFVERSLSLLDPENSNARILFLLPLDWNCTLGRASAWKKLNAHIHHEYRVEGRVGYLDRNGIQQNNRQVCDAVFDIRLGKGGNVTYLI